jgi:hypothetical protein
MDAALNWTVSPFAAPVIEEVSVPHRYRMAVLAVSQISMLVTVDHDAVTDQEIRLLFVCTPEDGAPNADDPIVEPPDGYPDV